VYCGKRTARKTTGGIAPCKKACVEEVPQGQEIAPEDVHSGQASHAPPPVAPPPVVGWTKEEYMKLGSNLSISHTRLMGLLQAYYSDKQTAVEYFCVENKHPQENSYWMTKVRISVWDVDKGGYQVYLDCFHKVSHATMEEIMDDAAF
jgi:hypothetical protein